MACRVVDDSRIEIERRCTATPTTTGEDMYSLWLCYTKDRNYIQETKTDNEKTR